MLSQASPHTRLPAGDTQPGGADTGGCEGVQGPPALQGCLCPQQALQSPRRFWRGRDSPAREGVHQGRPCRHWRWAEGTVQETLACWVHPTQRSQEAWGPIRGQGDPRPCPTVREHPAQGWLGRSDAVLAPSRCGAHTLANTRPRTGSQPLGGPGQPQCAYWGCGGTGRTPRTGGCLRNKAALGTARGQPDPPHR